MSVQVGAAVVAAVAFVYGVGFAVLPMRDWSDRARSRYLLGGAAVVGLLAVALIFTPWFIQRS